MALNDNPKRQITLLKRGYKPAEFGIHQRLERSCVGERGYEAWKRERELK